VYASSSAISGKKLRNVMGETFFQDTTPLHPHSPHFPHHPWVGFELLMLVVLGTDCTGSCKSNYQMIMIMTLPQIKQYEKAHLSNIWNFSILFQVYSYVHLFMKSYLFTSICVTKNSILKIRRTQIYVFI
jgi:hypothetical protein